ncbi:hypothetical protein Tco_0484700 [Tanacetum coccineum]
MDDLIKNRNAKLAAFQQKIDTLKETLSTHVKEKESLAKTLTVFKTESKEKESKYIDKEIVLEKQNKELENIISQRIKPTLYDGSAIVKEHAVVSVIDDEETLLLEEESRSKMLDKQNDPISLKQKINISLIYYSKLNKIKEDFGKRFVTQKELFAEQAFWLKHSNYNPDTSVKSHTPIRIEAPSELPRVSFVNESLKKLKYQLASFDKVVKMRTTSDAITADAWGFEHTKASFVTEIIPFLKVLKDTFNAFDKTLLDEITELSIDNDQLLKQIMSQEIMHIVVNSVDILDVKMSCVNECNKCLELETELLKKKDLIEKDDTFNENQNVPTFNQLFEINELKAQSQEKDMVIRKLKDMIKSLSRKDYMENVKKDIDEIETINIELEHRKDVVDTAVSKPSATIAPRMFKLDIEPISHRLKNNMDAHEKLLVYVSKTCPSLTKPCEKLVVVTPMNKDKKVRFAGPVTSSSIIPKQTDSLRTKDSNKPLLTSTGVKPTTSACGSKPSGNTKKNRITQPPSSNQKNKVDEHHRKVKSSLNKMNSVSEPISNVHVKHFVRNANIDSICVIFNKCLFDANHDMYVIDYVDDVNLLVPTKETSTKSVATPTQGILVYSRRPKATRSVGSSSKVKIVEFKTSNSKEPKQSWGSTVFDVPSSSLNDCRFGNNHIAKIMGYGDYQMGNVTISRVYYVEGLGHNLFFVEAVATAGYTQNRSLIQKRHNKTQYELLHDRKPDLSYLHVFGALCYPSNDDEDIAMASEQFSSGPGPKLLTPGIISSGLVPNIPSSTLYVPPTKNDWERLFQLMFDEYLNPPPCVDLQVPTVIAPKPVVSTGTPLLGIQKYRSLR